MQHLNRIRGYGSSWKNRDSLSEGCNDLIKLGAAVITRPEDILDIEEIRRKLDDCRNILKMMISNSSTSSEILHNRYD